MHLVSVHDFVNHNNPEKCRVSQRQIILQLHVVPSTIATPTTRIKFGTSADSSGCPTKATRMCHGYLDFFVETGRFVVVADGGDNFFCLVLRRQRERHPVVYARYWRHRARVIGFAVVELNLARNIPEFFKVDKFRIDEDVVVICTMRCEDWLGNKLAHFLESSKTTEDDESRL